ncbi:modulator of macroautophagy TMEM150B isoform X4 [Myotis yumanensis]|uniref:modulator of macroautophagy TMEM150B isoform X4 n=1 Tax=Myotis yumanensis TaxID=159337 RepID=UPI0038D4B5B9
MLRSCLVLSRRKWPFGGEVPPQWQPDSRPVTQPLRSSCVWTLLFFESRPLSKPHPQCPSVSSLSRSHRPVAPVAPTDGRTDGELEPSRALGMWGYLALLPAFLALWAATSIWTVFAIAVANKTVNLTEGIPYISLCGSFPPQSCIFSQLLNMGAAMAAWICILRYHQFRDWGVGKWFNRLILSSGLLCALGTSMVGNFQQKIQLRVHLTGAFLALFVGHVYFWLQLFLSWRMKSLPQPGAPWIGPLRLLLCSLCTVLLVTKPAPGL